MDIYCVLPVGKHRSMQGPGNTAENKTKSAFMESTL